MVESRKHDTKKPYEPNTHRINDPEDYFWGRDEKEYEKPRDPRDEDDFKLILHKVKAER